MCTAHLPSFCEVKLHIDLLHLKFWSVYCSNKCSFQSLQKRKNRPQIHISTFAALCALKPEALSSLPSCLQQVLKTWPCFRRCEGFVTATAAGEAANTSHTQTVWGLNVAVHCTSKKNNFGKIRDSVLASYSPSKRCSAILGQDKPSLFKIRFIAIATWQCVCVNI